VIRVRAFAATVAIAFAPALVRGAVSPETGSYFYQRYLNDQYGASPQNWAVAQDRRGIMYFANTDAVLEFDGQTWRPIRLPDSAFVSTVAADRAGTVYVGGQGVFGLLKPDASGTMQFVSLLDKVPAADRKFTDVWRILPTPQGVYFSAYERLFRLNPDGSLRVWRPLSNFGRAIAIQDALYVKMREKGLMKMEGDTLSLAPGGEVFQKLPVQAGASAGNGGLIGVAGGFYRLDADGVKAFPTAADSYFAANILYTFRVFPDGEIAAGTRKGGVVLLSPDGKIDRILTQATGLTDDYIADIFRDRQGGVWLACNNGITYFNPGLSRFESPLGLAGDVRYVTRADGAVYSGTTKGLFVMKTAPGEAPKFERIPGIDTAVSVVLPRGDHLLAATDTGIFDVAAGHARPVFVPKDSVMFDVAASPRDPSIVFAVGRAGVFVLQQRGSSWVKTGEFSAPGQPFTSARQDPDGRVWAITNEAIWRLDFSQTSVKSESFGDPQGAPAGLKNPRLIKGRVVFATPRGLRRWSEGGHRFEPDPEFGSAYADGSRDVFDIYDDPAGNVWITGRKYHDMLFHKGADYAVLHAPLYGSGIQEIYEMNVDPDGTAWAFGDKGILYRWQRSLYGNPDQDFQVLVRRVGTTADNTALYGGAGDFPSTRLSYRENALRFEFAAPFSEAPGAVEYQVFLQGSDHGWSPWSPEPRKEYTHLSEGSYTFRVRARSPHGAMAENAAIAFSMAPPWYRTWWAYALYLVLAGLAVRQIVGWRTRQLVAEKERLEEIVEERTVEIREQRDEIQRQERKGNSLLLNILPETVAEELKASGTVRPVTFDDVTVCFTDFVGFTLSSEQLSAEALVDKLNLYFTAFDEIMARYGLEKLKTIGDSYMFASGLPNARPSHAVDAVMAAVEMVDVVKSFHPVTGWDIRVGLHSGPVVAGVVGTKKFAFDIWGNTVNLASRMESSGVAGRVNLSEQTYRLTRGLIDCEDRGYVHTKDGRDIPMFLVRQPAADFTTRYEAEFGAPEHAIARAI
jgi:class 3 adenylate cyclase